ncbi:MULTISPECIES: acetoin utilization protein AcuC [Actibacterium]|uniref:Acetoin utilization protein AcuC n=1 Tax=Actibacterium naphthalenivorans TaxID=1614693 RepID=A0A840C916_9RHOB|nr:MULTISPECIES: acetoin utilization protein AcuC [Actibacterium]ALG91814.1 acetoin utilization protein [Actibacterium sp. EMB200-NS6]MBB4020542.1 acetoin utilization protein AcuC [Actibacterium naphthalenivorans]
MTAEPPRFIGSEIYRKSSFGPWHPLRIPRVSTVIDLTRAMGWLPPARYVASPRAKPAALGIWHDPAYLAALQRAEAEQVVSDETRARYHIGTHSNPVYPEMYRRPATGAGGSLLAGELLADGGVIYHPAGGTHHGMPDRANGFCFLNDPVLAILSLRRAGARRVAYVDIDAHHPDGVELAFAGDPETLLISVHEEKRWPFTGALGDDGGGNVFNLPVPRGLNDSEMAAVLDALILPRVAAFRADAIVLQCGADAVEEDPLSRLSLSNNAHWAVVAALRPLSPRYLVLGGGGYNPWSVGRLWAGVWATLAGHDIPDRLPKPAEAVLRSLSWEGNRRGRDVPEHLFTTLRDAPRAGAVGAELRARLAVLGRRAAP